MSRKRPNISQQLLSGSSTAAVRKRPRIQLEAFKAASTGAQRESEAPLNTFASDLAQSLPRTVLKSSLPINPAFTFTSEPPSRAEVAEPAVANAECFETAHASRPGKVRTHHCEV